MGLTSRACCIIIFLQFINIVTCQENDKRVPQGFHGVRGKKEYELENYNGIFKRKPHYFIGVKGKKYSEYPLDYQNYGFDTEQQYGYIFPKKDGTLIGKIDYAARPIYNIELIRNFPVLQEIMDNYLKAMDQRYNIQDTTSDSEGSSDEGSAYMTKRSAKWNQFYGVRGKKAISEKRPFDLSFRGKFIGVRGKKDGRYNNNAKEIKFLLGPEGPWPKRKGQMSGFFGMRGKKYAEESIEVPSSSSELNV